MQHRASSYQGFFFTESCAYKNCDSYSKNTLTLFYVFQQKKFPLPQGGTPPGSESEATFDRFFMTHEILQQIQGRHEKFTAFCKNSFTLFLLTFHHSAGCRP